MKNKITLIGITVIISVIGFAVTACDNGINNNSGNSACTHDWNTYDQTIEPTCTLDGIKTRTCKLCSETDTVTETGDPALGHDWEVIGGTPPTCTEKGNGSAECKRCDASIENAEIPELGHNWNDYEEVTPPTCTETGIMTRTCKRNDCGTTDAVTQIGTDATGHNFGNWTVTSAPNCTTAGEEKRNCQNNDCDETEKHPIAALGHDWSNWITTASFISAGEKSRTCNNDVSHLETHDIPSLPITTTGDWNTAVSQINGKTGDYTLNISGNIGVAGSNTNTFGTTESDFLSVTLKGTGKFYLTSQGYMFYIFLNQTLIIDSEDLVLEGLTTGQNGAVSNNTRSIVWTAGTLIMNNGKIIGNNTSGNGGGVDVANGTFTMNGGEISNNTASGYTSGGGGGGVYVSSGDFIMNNGEISNNTATGTAYSSGGGVYLRVKTFTMNGGKISNNTAVATYSNSGFGGGGVYVDGGIFTMQGGEISGNYVAGSSSASGGGVYLSSNYGTFRIVTGIIYGSNADADFRNRTSSGYSAALSINAWNENDPEYGTFTDDTWNKNGSLPRSTNETIKVVNGVLQ